MIQRFVFIFATLLLLPASGVLGAKPTPPAPTLSEVFKRVGPAVAVIRTSEHAVVAQPGEMAGRATSVNGIGSGVLISADGKVLTAAHVVHLADSVLVDFPGNAMLRARVVASDPAADVALLQLSGIPAGITPATLGDSDRAEVGDQVFVVGAPLGVSHTMTVGHLSARRAPSTGTGSMSAAELFQTDAAINQGNSGGPMFNMDGEVIGVVSHILSRSGGSDGLGFAVTLKTAHRLLFEAPSVWSGLQGYFLTGDLALAFNLPSGASGLLVQRVADRSPAHRIGIRGGTLPAAIGEEQVVLGGDVILSVEGIALSERDAYEKIRLRLIELRKSNEPLHVSVLRGGELLELTGTTTP